MKKIKLIRFSVKTDDRGKLSYFETGTNISMSIKRVFSVLVPYGKKRGNHAHKKCTQIIICIQGKIKIFVTNGLKKKKLFFERDVQGSNYSS